MLSFDVEWPRKVWRSLDPNIQIGEIAYPNIEDCWMELCMNNQGRLFELICWGCGLFGMTVTI